MRLLKYTVWALLAAIIPLAVARADSTFRYPVDGEWTVTNDFWSCSYQCWHLGEDSGRDAGTPVYAPSDGIVKHTAAKSKYGNVIIIEHALGGETVATVMGHLRSSGLNVSVGQSVTKGYLLGYLGDSSENGGFAPHIHYGVNKGVYSGDNALGCDGKWVYAGYANDSCVQTDWYDPTDFNQAHAPCNGGGPWSGWIGDPNSNFSQGPSAASWGCNRLDVFVRGNEGALWTKSYNGGWGGWYRPAASDNFRSGPAAVSWGYNRLDVFVTGYDNKVWWYNWNGSQWSCCTDIGGVVPGGGTAGPPAVASWGPNRLDVFVVGGNGKVYQKTFTGSWSSWIDRGGSVGVAGPGAVSWGPNRIDIFVRGNDQKLWWKAYNNGSWIDWRIAGPSNFAIGSLGVSASTWGVNHLDVYAVGTNAHVYHLWTNNGGSSWSSWEDLAGYVPPDRPGSANWGYDRQDVFVRGSDSRLYWKHYGP